MKELTDKEIQWLEAFAKNHEFFASFLLHYKLKNSLSNNQHYWLNLYINQAEEQVYIIAIEIYHKISENKFNIENYPKLIEGIREIIRRLKYSEE